MYQHIWTHDVLDENELDELTEKEIMKVEHSFKIKLPTSYIELMKMKNGGDLDYRILPCDPSFEDGQLIIDFLFGISMNEGIGQTTYFVKEWGLPNDLILLSGDGHSWLALDYRGKEKTNPPIVYIDTEQGLDLKVAHTFTDFLNKLQKQEMEDGENGDVYDAIFNKTYVEQEVEQEVEPYELSYGIDFFADKPCDINWFLSQVERSVDFIEEEDLFAVYGILTSLMKKISHISIEETPYLEVKRILGGFKEYKGFDLGNTVQKAACKIEKYLDKKEEKRE